MSARKFCTNFVLSNHHSPNFVHRPSAPTNSTGTHDYAIGLGVRLARSWKSCPHTLGRWNSNARSASWNAALTEHNTALTNRCFVKSIHIDRTICFTKPTHGLYNEKTQMPTHMISDASTLSAAEYEEIVEDTLHSLNDYFEEILENSSLIDFDVYYSDGVLTVKLAPGCTYVINKQTPNKQIWLSSPSSGPKRYDFENQTWIYKHENRPLHSLLNDEIPKLVSGTSSKVSGLLLAEKNLVDFVDKNLGQERDRLRQDELEMDKVCQHLVGGSLDYPMMISHDICDIISAFDVYIEAFTKGAASQIPKEFGFGIFEKPAEKNPRLGKMPFRGDELTQNQFVSGVITCGLKIRNHIIECTEECTQSGRLENLYVIVSNIVMVRNYVWIFLRTFDVDANSKLKEEYKELCNLVEVISEQMLQAQANLLATFVIHDETSQCWSSFQPYYEGQRGSPTIQMWNYSLKGMQRDMWKIMPPQLSQRILGIILNDSLAILVARYSQITPTRKTLPQYICDVINILSCAEEFLFHISSNISQVCGDVDPSISKITFSIHMKCHCLATSLVLLGTPIEVLYKTFRRGLSSCKLLQKEKRQAFIVEKIQLPTWMQTLTKLCPHIAVKDLTCESVSLLFHLKLLSSQPHANWSLVFKVLTMNDCRLASFILNLFPNVAAPATEFLLEGKAFKRCGYAACMSPSCHSLPKSVANHHISACIVYIIAHTIPREYFVQTYKPVLSAITDWSVLDKTRIWTSTNRPVWFQCLVDMLLPQLKVCVQSLCITIVNKIKVEPTYFTKKERDEEISTQLVTELLITLTDSLSMIPRGFFLVCEEMDDLVPKTFYPVRNNVAIHFLISSLYALLNLGPGIIASTKALIESTPVTSQQSAESEFPQKTLENLLLSTSERLCHLDDIVFDQIIHRLISQMDSMMKQTQSQLARKKALTPQVPFVITNDLASLKVDFLLEDAEGQLALRVAYWFLITHSDVLQNVIIENTDNQTNRSRSRIPSSRRRRSRSLSPTNRELETVKSKKSMGASQKQGKLQEKTLPHSIGSDPDFSKSSNEVTTINPFGLKIAPRVRTYRKAANIIHEFHYVNKSRTFDEIIWNIDELDWVATVRQTNMGLHKALILKQLERRFDFHATPVPVIVNQPPPAPTEANTTGEADAKEAVLSNPAAPAPTIVKTELQLTTMINEIKALMMA